MIYNSKPIQDIVLYNNLNFLETAYKFIVEIFSSQAHICSC